MPMLHVNHVDLYFESHGPETGELVILNNGVFMNTGSWVFQLPDLAKRYRVLAYDMRGQGQSEHPESDYSLELHAEDLVALMDALGLAKAHMIGTSYGGELNLVMGIHHPERCRSLVIIASPRTLGAIRPQYHAALTAILAGELAKDLTGHAVSDVEKAIQAA